MEVRYLIESTKARKKMMRAAARQIYRSDQTLRMIKVCDAILLTLCMGLAVYFFLQSGTLIHMGVADWYASDEIPLFTSLPWLRWSILLGVYSLGLYAICLRPALISRVINHFLGSLSKGENQLAIQDEGLLHAGGYGHTLFQYTEVRRVTDIGGFLVVFIGQGHLHAVPHSAFAHAGQRQQFAELLRSKAGLQYKPD